METNEFSSLKIAAIGGGHGLSTLLRGLKKMNHNITAVVTVADNGGSSGALRRDIGILPPGDIRNCLAALSDDEIFMTQVLRYRFSNTSGVGSHNMGNLLLTALANITGSFEGGIHELAGILGIHGNVTPSTLANIDLVAEVQTVENGLPVTRKIVGESQITECKGKIKRCWLEPKHISANPEAIHAILHANLILLGPGSLYTSILPNLMVPSIAEAINASEAVKLYICNMTTQRGETDGFNVLNHVKIIESYLPDVTLSGIICNNFHESELQNNISWCKITEEAERNYRIFQNNLVDEGAPWRHNPDKLSVLVSKAYLELSNEINNREKH